MTLNPVSIVLFIIAFFAYIRLASESLFLAFAATLPAVLLGALLLVVGIT